MRCVRLHRSRVEQTTTLETRFTVINSERLRSDRKPTMSDELFPVGFDPSSACADEMTSLSNDRVPDTCRGASCRHKLRRKSGDFRVRRREGRTANAAASVFRRRSSRTSGNADFRFIDFRSSVMSVVVFVACLQSTVLCVHPGSTGVASANRDASVALNRSLPTKSFAASDLSGDVINGVRCRVRCLSLLQVSFASSVFFLSIPLVHCRHQLVDRIPYRTSPLILSNA